MKAIIAAILMVWCVGCANPGFIIQPVEDDPSLLVGLASSPDSSAEAETRHDHPVEWTTGDLQAILKRLAIQEGSGLLDSSRRQQTVFSQEDLTHLIPALQQTFKIARPSDWIVFAVWGSSEQTQGLQVTSGGMYLQDQQLHILLANHRERVSSEEDGIQAIHKNPFHALRDVKRSLLFYPTSYVMESGNNWIMSGFESPVSEIILDYQALLATNRQETPTESAEASASETPKTDRITSPTTDVELGTLQEEISTLKEELSRLKQQIKQQAEDPSQTNTP
jgi:HAMP domain-containing protein